MIRDIVHDPMLLSKKSSEAGIGDLGIVQDLQDTLKPQQRTVVWAWLPT